LTLFLAVYNLPSALTTAITSEVFAILMRAVMKPSVALDISNDADRGKELTGTNTEMFSTSGSVVVTVTDTTAPFSAISGALTLTASLLAGSAEPTRACKASGYFLALKACSGQADKGVLS